jgi:hypothetical protein
MERVVELTMVGSASAMIHRMILDETYRDIVLQRELMLELVEKIEFYMGGKDFVDKKEFMEFISLVRSNVIDFLVNMNKIRSETERRLFYCAEIHSFKPIPVPMVWIDLKLLDIPEEANGKEEKASDTRSD